ALRSGQLHRALHPRDRTEIEKLHGTRALRRTAPRRSFSPPWTRRGGARSATGWSTILLAATPPRRLRRHPSSKEEGKIQAPLSLRILQPAVARAARPRAKVLARLGVAALEHPLHALAPAAVPLEPGEQRLRVGAADVGPPARDRARQRPPRRRSSRCRRSDAPERNGETRPSARAARARPRPPWCCPRR